jgi:hypothetical protein
MGEISDDELARLALAADPEPDLGGIRIWAGFVPDSGTNPAQNPMWDDSGVSVDRAPRSRDQRGWPGGVGHPEPATKTALRYG